MVLPLEGVRVLDLAHALAGPSCSNVLQRFGAEVIKIERPGVGDDMRHFSSVPGLEGMAPSFCIVNAGKSSISLDLKNPPSREVLHRLVKTCDILVENFRPGVTKDLGADWETLHAVNPRLIYCSLTGFGQVGELSQRTAYDHIIQATTGLMVSNGGAEGPRRLGMPAVDTFSGYYGAVAVLAALRRRDLTGEGEMIDVGMMDAAMTMMSSAATTAVLTGQDAKPSTDRAWRVVPTAGIFATADGYIDLGANHQHQVIKLFDVLSLSELATDPRFDSHAGRQKNGDALFDILNEAIGKRSAAELDAALTAVNVPIAEVRTIGAAARSRHVEQRRLMVDAHAPGLDKPLRLMRGVPRLEGMTDDVGAIPRLGEHTEAVLAGLGYSDTELAEFRTSGVI